MCKRELADSPKIKVTEKREPCREQWILAVRLPRPFLQLRVPAQCLCNETLGIANRVLGDDPETHHSVVLMLHDAMQRMGEEIRAARLDPRTLLLRCPKGKLKTYSKALVSLLDAPVYGEDSKVKAFVKMERSELLMPNQFKDPRIIQARMPRFNVMLGMYTRAIEEQLKYIVDPEWRNLGVLAPAIAKGHNLVHRARTLEKLWNLYDDPVAISLDLSRWDMRVSDTMLMLLSQFYLQVFPDLYLEELLENLTDNRCKSTKGVRYVRTHGVTSGDMTTALGNCVAVIAINWALRKVVADCAAGGAGTPAGSVADISGKLCKDRESPNHCADHCVPCMAEKAVFNLATVSRDCKVPVMTIYDDGDDHVLMTDRRYSTELQELLPLWWSLMGHRLTVEGVVDCLEQVKFCQMKWMPGIPIMVPDPRKVVASSLTLANKWLRNPKPYLKTIWRARAIMHNGVPVLGPLFHRLERQIKVPLLSPKVIRAELQRQDYWLSMSEKKLEEDYIYQAPTMQSRDWMLSAWGIDQETQLVWESMKIRSPEVHISPLDIPLEDGYVVPS